MRGVRDDRDLGHAARTLVDAQHAAGRYGYGPARASLLTCVFLLTLLTAPAAWARDPITPLRDVHRGLQCTARTVVQGTTMSDFDVEVLDVVADQFGSGARILVRVSGPAVAASGIASGFSGRPSTARMRTASSATPARSPRRSASTARTSGS